MSYKLKGKKILVTGADGFIGSHLVERLLNEGAIVRALVQYNSFGKWGLLEDIKNIEKFSNLDVVLGDIRDPQQSIDLCQDQDLIFHLAALIDIPYSYIAPASYFQTNVLGTVNLLEGVRRNKVKRFIHTSTSEVYGTALYSPMNEEHPLQSQSPYAASKVGADKAALSYFMSFGLPVSVVRPFNNYGPRQSSRGVIPTIISQILTKEIKQVKLGSLKPIRDYVYVKDTVEGFIQIASSPDTIGEVVNIGSGQGYSIEQIYKMIVKITGINKVIKTDPKRIRPQKSEVWKLVCNNEKLIKLTNWKQKTSFEEGLKETINWIENNLNEYKTGRYNI